MKWMLIETAPPNQQIMIWCRGSPYDEPGWKIGKIEKSGRNRFPVISNIRYRTYPDAYTHWRPLPPPPAEADGMFRAMAEVYGP